jgi:hypothetical protein
LEKVKLVKQMHKGVGSVFGYYPLNYVSMRKIMDKPRNVSLTFDATETEDTPVTGLVEYKKIVFLVKSTSRFFLKPDIGEVIDQIDFHDWFGVPEFDAICVHLDEYELLDGTDGEHFLMTATLLKDEQKEKKQAIEELYKLRDESHKS